MMDKLHAGKENHFISADCELQVDPDGGGLRTRWFSQFSLHFQRNSNGDQLTWALVRLPPPAGVSIQRCYICSPLRLLSFSLINYLFDNIMLDLLLE